MNHGLCYEWFKRIKEGWQSIHDEPHLGRPSTLDDNAHVAQYCENAYCNRHLTVREIAEECYVLGSCNDILMTKLEMHLVVSKFAPLLLLAWCHLCPI
jgi:hypothetical protein